MKKIYELKKRYIFRIRVQGRCSMYHFENFPLDTQSCQLVLESCGYSVAEVRLRSNSYPFFSNNLNIKLFLSNFRWMPWNPVSIASQRFQLPDFKFMNLTFHHQAKIYAAGEWDQLEVNFVFKRLYGYYVLQVLFKCFASPIIKRLQAYLPSYLFVFISWISFWIDRYALPARILLCVNAACALIYQVPFTY